MCAKRLRPCGWLSSCHATRHFMLAKMSAAWLVVLVLSPFSAPFSTCDLPTLFHVEVPDGGDPTRPLVPSHSLEYWATRHGLPRAPFTSRLKVLAWAELHSRTLTFDQPVPREVHPPADARAARLPSVFSTLLRL